MTQTTFHLFFIGKVTSLNEIYLTLSEVASLYRVTPRTVRAWTLREIDPLEAYEAGNQILIPESALDVFIKPVQPRRQNQRVMRRPANSRAIPTTRK